MGTPNLLLSFHHCSSSNLHSPCLTNNNKKYRTEEKASSIIHGAFLLSSLDLSPSTLLSSFFWLLFACCCNPSSIHPFSSFSHCVPSLFSYYYYCHYPSFLSLSINRPPKGMNEKIEDEEGKGKEREKGSSHNNNKRGQASHGENMKKDDAATATAALAPFSTNAAS